MANHSPTDGQSAETTQGVNTVSITESHTFVFNESYLGKVAWKVNGLTFCPFLCGPTRFQCNFMLLSVLVVLLCVFMSCLFFFCGFSSAACSNGFLV